MISAAERDRSQTALEMTLPVQRISPVETVRVNTINSLKFKFLREQLHPNTITEVESDGHPWRIIASHGPYSENESVMVIDWSDRHIPGPEEVADREGEELISIIADVAEVITQNPDNEVVSVGWNWSRRSYNQRGFQSIPGKWHPVVFGLPKRPDESHQTKFMRLIDTDGLNDETKRAILGHPFNKYIGSLLLSYLLSANFPGNKEVLSSLLDVDNARVGEKGIRIPLKKDLTQTLRSKGAFTEFLQPIGQFLNQAAIDVSTAFTDFNPGEVDRRIEETVTNPSDNALQELVTFLTREPHLLSPDERLEKIGQLAAKDYPHQLVRFLRLFNNMLPAEGFIEGWKRGFAYALVIRHDKTSDTAELMVSGAVANGHGGVVETAEGAILLRPPDQEFSQEEMAVKISQYRNIANRVNGHQQWF